MSHKGNLFRGNSPLFVFLAVIVPFVSACGSANQPDLVATGVFQTQQVSQLETAAAASQLIPTQELAAPTVAPALSFEGMLPPDGVIQQDGRWFFQDREAILTPHVNEDGSTDLWLSFALSPDWPLYIQNEDGTWRLGAEAWTGEITIVNTNEVPIRGRRVGLWRHTNRSVWRVWRIGAGTELFRNIHFFFDAAGHL